VDFRSRQKIRLEFRPASRQVNSGRPVTVAFIPGSKCQFGDQRGCVNVFYLSDGTPVILVSVHSGVGGEGQRLRHALEGTGFNAAGLTLEQARRNLRGMAGSRVLMGQGQAEASAQVIAAGRIPAQRLESYFAARLDRAVEMGLAAAGNPDYDTRKPLLVIETCGWRMPGEPGGAAVSDTTGSVYLVILQ
jgi:hypothetical protein